MPSSIRTEAVLLPPASGLISRLSRATVRVSAPAPTVQTATPGVTIFARRVIGMLTLGIFRDISIERFTLQLRGEGTNAFNLVSLNAPTANLASTLDGKITLRRQSPPDSGGRPAYLLTWSLGVAPKMTSTAAQANRLSSASF